MDTTTSTTTESTDIVTTRIYTHITNKKVENDYIEYHPRSKK